MIQAMLPNDHLEVEVVHKSLEGVGLSYDTGLEMLESPNVDERKFPLLQAFTHFGAGKNFRDYMLSYDNKKQEVSTV